MANWIFDPIVIVKNNPAGDNCCRRGRKVHPKLQKSQWEICIRRTWKRGDTWRLSNPTVYNRCFKVLHELG